MSTGEIHVAPTTVERLRAEHPEGSRHLEMRAIATSLLGSGIAQPAVFVQIRSSFRDTDISDKEIHGIVAWAASKNPAPPNPDHYRFPTGGAAGKPPAGNAKEQEMAALLAKAGPPPSPGELADRLINGHQFSEPDWWEKSPVRPSGDFENDATLLFSALYKWHNHINIVTDYTLDKNGKAQPAGAGKTLLRGHWLNAFRSAVPSSEAGAWFRPNPIIEDIGSGYDGSICDRDTAEFRFLLIESDKLSFEQQLNLYGVLHLPLAAIYTSGGAASVHALALLAARDEEEYRKLAAEIYSILGPLGFDENNKNPSRLSRLPGVTRHIRAGPDPRQHLIYLNPSPLPLDLARLKESATPENPADRAYSVSELASTPPDPTDTLLGDRFLCRTGAMLFVGPSGVGKSSASMVMDISWSCGRDAFGIAPPRPLRVLCVQAENDPGDLHEMAKGALASLELEQEERALVEQNFKIIRHQTSVGIPFLLWLKKQLGKHPSDLVRLDPLLAYLGSDPVDAAPLATFCRVGLNSLLSEFNLGAIVNHHTPKTNYRDTSEWKPSDWMYAGGGAADLTNWARAILVVDPTDDPAVFRFIAAKRGRRIGWQDEHDWPTQERFFSHSQEWGKIIWSETPQDVSEGLASSKKHGGRNVTEGQFIELLPAVRTDNPQACLITMSELELKARENKIQKNGLAGIRDQLEREEKIFVHKSTAHGHAIRIGRIEIKHLLVPMKSP